MLDYILSGMKTDVLWTHVTALYASVYVFPDGCHRVRGGAGGRQRGAALLVLRPTHGVLPPARLV